MRLDLFLKYSRLVPRRPVAQKMCDAGAVSVNDAVAKSAREIRLNDRIVLTFPRRVLAVRVIRIPTRPPSKSEAALLYEALEERIISKESDSPATASFDIESDFPAADSSDTSGVA